MGALFNLKCAYDLTLVYVCYVDAEKCILVETIMSQTPQTTHEVAYYASRISPGTKSNDNAEKTRLSKYTCRLSFSLYWHSPAETNPINLP